MPCDLLLRSWSKVSPGTDRSRRFTLSILGQGEMRGEQVGLSDALLKMSVFGSLALTRQSNWAVDRPRSCWLFLRSASLVIAVLAQSQNVTKT